MDENDRRLPFLEEQQQILKEEIKNLREDIEYFEDLLEKMRGEYQRGRDENRDSSLLYDLEVKGKALKQQLLQYQREKNQKVTLFRQIREEYEELLYAKNLLLSEKIKRNSF